MNDRASLNRISLSPDARRNLGLALMAALAIYGVAYMRDPGGGHLIDAINLAIHETGHLVFAVFGEVIAALGGTLFQLIIPLTFCVYFLRRGDRLGAATCLWWTAINCFNISVYVADARSQELDLVGGGEHDWAFLLGEWGLLQSDHGIARAWRAVGFVLFLVAIAAGIRAAVTSGRAPDRSSEPESVPP
jgi:hypothetical protein